MNLSLNLSGKLNFLKNTLCFFKKHFLVILGLGLIAALGRVIQLGGFGEIASWANIILEIVVGSARILIFVYVLGMANLKTGFLRIKKFFTHMRDFRRHWTIAIQNLKKNWFSITLNICGFLLIVGAVNYLIDLLAYETCLYLTLKKDGLLADSSSEWTILLFFKNLSTIPFALVFETLFILWITNNLIKQKTPSFN
jgi:hypothetical protein